MSTTLETYKREFLEDLEIEKGRSLKTIENYDRYLSRFLEFAHVEAPKDITDELVRNFRLWLNRQPGQAQRGNAPEKQTTLSRKTQNYYLIALRAFLKYLRKRGIESLQPERIELAKVPEHSLDLITPEELERFMRGADGEDLHSLRDRAILELLFSTGLRVSELCALSRDINLKSDELSVRGKGGKIRVVFLSETAREILQKYLEQRTDMDDALFIRLNKNGAYADRNGSLRLTPRSVERIVKHYAVKAGLADRVTPHTLRHLYATDLLQNGADVRSVQALLGHASIATTQVYTHITDSHLRDIHKAFHGKRRKNDANES